MTTGDAIYATLQSPNVADSNSEPANVVDVIDKLAYRLLGLRDSITVAATTGEDATGGGVSCLTEAVMGVTAGLVKIADSINNLAEAVRESSK